jgi:hypothetical protein
MTSMTPSILGPFDYSVYIWSGSVAPCIHGSPRHRWRRQGIAPGRASCHYKGAIPCFTPAPSDGLRSSDLSCRAWRGQFALGECQSQRVQWSDQCFHNATFQVSFDGKRENNLLDSGK